MNNTIKTSPNQKTITVKKEKADKNNYYTIINLNALELAAQNLKSGAFKLWIYFAKNQHNFTFGLSNKEVAETFGIKKDQYDKAVKELIEKGYLIETSKNHYDFIEVQEKPTIKNGEKPQLKVVKTNTKKQEKPITNITDNTINTTKENKFIF